jgi:hypothetical protein
MFGTRILTRNDDLVLNALAHLSEPDFRHMNDYAAAAVVNIELGHSATAGIFAQLACRIATAALDAEIARRGAQS